LFSADAVKVSERNIAFSACKLRYPTCARDFSRLQRFQTGSEHHAASHKMGTGVQRTIFRDLI